MDFEPLPSAAGDATADETPPGRAVCSSGCGRPSTVCLCPYLPATPLPTSTTVVILHHPHALRVISRSPVLLLFPSPDAVNLASWCRSTPPPARANPTLLLLDGTWKQAKEMHAASLPFLSSFAVPVSLPVDCGVDGDSMFEGELVVKKEPHKGCVSTMEAVARALRLLEPEGRGEEIEETMVGVLRAMVAFQAEHLQHRPMKPRVKMRKKKDIKREEEMKRNTLDWSD
uniref:tRNA-uridine aminocarboxypropyltransferase n=1 Tax=Oryza barthii TaxID=65489 RepID=A0A0D3HRB8_9ORYZ